MSEVIRITKQGEGHWADANGRVEFHHDHTFETECDAPHPVRVTEATFKGYSDWFQRSIFNPSRKGGYVSWMCDGGEIHHYSQWTIQIDGEWVGNTKIDGCYDTLTQAIGAIEQYMGWTIIRTPTRRKPVQTERATRIDERTGAATWVACGHRSELDINEHCYTCHQPVEVEVAA
jgi:hypothetical protein